MLRIVERSGQATGFMDALSESDRLVINEYIKRCSLSERLERRTVNKVGRFMVEVLATPDRKGMKLYVQSLRYAENEESGRVRCDGIGR